MREDDIKQLLTILKLNYPATYRDMSIEDRRALVKLWFDAFGGFDVEVVGQALKNSREINTRQPLRGYRNKLTCLSGQIIQTNYGVC